MERGEDKRGERWGDRWKEERVRRERERGGGGDREDRENEGGEWR